MNDLLQQYKFTLKRIKEAQVTASDEDRKLLGGMASDVQYAIDWISLGGRPGNRRGVERRSVYQNTRYIDPSVFEKVFAATEPEPERELDTWSQLMIEDAMSTLTERERELFVMRKVNMMSYGEIAKLCRIHRQSAKDAVERAEKKIRKQVQESLFCNAG
ncbi:sigma-70 family RNA polymerase sigma factor [Ectobacillus antri]|uniref:sigma-70 family RNA polymerase sigma factor n=1 Tax=Ectobacillus antri TaxID=2486280 RepID=UPI000F5A8572|nr:sigma-70 family RNA polymerase sigma factor [Ectobacillus antri]